tara:strand:- start:6047 stop:6367 length:321 start_codon:yes stop_codon:yes gene_type:complete
MKKSAPYERAEQDALVKKLNRMGTFVFHIPNHKEMHKDPGAMSGIPDLQICLEGGKVIWIELKRRKGGTVSKVQKEIHARLEALGHTVIIGYGAKDAFDKLGENID